MKLSIHIIYRQIATPESQLITSQRVSLNLTDIRFYRPEQNNLSESLIYLIDEPSLTAIQSEKPLHFICLGAIDVKQLNPNWSVIILPAPADKAIIFDAVQTIFDDYQQWLDDINAAIFSGTPLQTILDQACMHLKNPVALFDDSQGLLLRTSTMKLDKLDAIWSHVLEKGYSLREVDSAALNEKFTTQHAPFYYQSPDSFGSIKRLIAPILVNGQIFGTLGMTELISPLTEAEYANLCLTQTIIENALTVNDEFCKNPETPWYLSHLINERFVDTPILSHHLGQKGRTITDPFFLWCFSQPNKRLAPPSISTAIFTP